MDRSGLKVFASVSTPGYTRPLHPLKRGHQLSPRVKAMVRIMIRVMIRFMVEVLVRVQGAHGGEKR